MSLITLKSKFDSNDTAADFKCDFPQLLEIAPKSEVELINFQFKRKEEYKIDENNDILVFIFGAGAVSQQRQIHIPHGTYTGEQLVKTIAQVANEATVNSAFRNIRNADGTPKDASGWSGTFSQTGGVDPGGGGGAYPLVVIGNDQNGYDVVSGTGSKDGKSWRFANVSNGDELPTSQYTIVEDNANGTQSTFTPGAAGALGNNYGLSRNIISNYGMYDAYSQFSVRIKPTQGGRLPTSNYLTNYTLTNAGTGYQVGDEGEFSGGSGTGATYRIDSVVGGGAIDAIPTGFTVLSEGAGYSGTDVLTFAGQGDGNATITVNAVEAAIGYAKTRTGVSRYTTFFPRGALPAEQWDNTQGDFMCQIFKNQLTISSLTYNNQPPGTPGYRTTVISPGRNAIDMSTLDWSTSGLPAPNFGVDHLKIEWIRTNMRMQCKLAYDTAGNGTFGTSIVVADTILSAGANGKITASMAEIRFPYIPFIYAAVGVSAHNVLTVDALYSPFSVMTIIGAQNNHIDGYNNSSRGLKWAQQDGVSSKISEQQLANQEATEADNDLTDLSATPGQIIGLQTALKINEIQPQDLVSAGGLLPDNLLEPNIANAGPTLGDSNVNYFFESSTNYTSPSAYKFDSPLTGDFDTTYFIELPDLPIKSFNGFSTDIGKSIMVVPREQLTTGEFEGVMYYQPPYPVKIQLKNIDMMRLNSLRVQIRNSDGTLCTDLNKPSQLLIKITPTEPSVREALKELGRVIGIRQDTKIDSIGDTAPRI